MIDPMKIEDNSNHPNSNLLDRVRSQVLEMYEVDFDLVPTNTLPKDIVQNSEMNFDNDSTK